MAERGSPKYEKAAMRWLERYVAESSPRLQHFAEITASLAKCDPRSCGETGRRKRECRLPSVLAPTRRPAPDLSWTSMRLSIPNTEPPPN